jgi:hypothetical protein
MIAFALLGLFFALAASANAFDWGVDSRDPRFSLSLTAP